VIVFDASVWVRSLVDNGSMGAAARWVFADDLRWTAPAHARLIIGPADSNVRTISGRGPLTFA